MNKKILKAIVPSCAFLLISASIIIGGTYALFTSESKVNIAVTSGKLELVSKIDNLTAYSHEDISMTDYTGTKVDRTDGTFLTEGTYAYDETNNLLTLDKIVPGDGVNFDIVTTNNSNVAIKYRVVIKTTEDSELATALTIKVDGEDYKEGGSAYSSLAPLAAVPNIAVSIELPCSANNDYQDKTFKFCVTLQAVQGNADTSTASI